MVGRPRRASTSSVETVDENRILWRQETSVLKSVPASQSADPPACFELRDAVVLNKDGQTLENALYVGTRGPYIVRGTMVVDDAEQKTHLIMRVRNSIPLEIRRSTRYSIGEAEGGQAIIWVLGKGSWYEINPSPAYLPIYNKMCEAVVLYYRIMDIYKAKKPKKAKKGKKDQMKELYRVFHEYAAMVGDGSTLEEVLERCDEHASFLISQCLQEEGFDWSDNPFYKWLVGRHHVRHGFLAPQSPADLSQDLFEKTQERLRNPPQPQRSPSVETRAPAPVLELLTSRTRSGSSAPSTTRSNATPEVVELEDSPPRQRSTRSRSTTHRGPDNPVDLTGRPQPQKGAHAIARPPSAHSATSSSSMAPAASNPSSPANNEDVTPFQSVVDGLELVYKTQSKKGMTMLSTLNKLYLTYKFPNYKNGQSGCHKIPAEEVLHYNAEALLETLDKARFGGHELYSWLQEAVSRPFRPVAIKPSEFPYSLIQRGNRPRPVKANQPPAASPFDDDVSSGPRSSPAGKSLRRPGRPSGIKSSLRLATESKKRPHSDVDSDSEDEELVPKKSHYFANGDEVMEDEAGSSSPEEAEVSREASPIKIVIRADKIPSTVPHGPNETWVCEEEDCGYVVRGGDVDKCQERIKRHFRQHEDQMERVNLAMTEGTRGHLPIKYAYFPPFLILVEFPPPSTTTNATTTTTAATNATTTATSSPIIITPTAITQSQSQPQEPTPSPGSPREPSTATRGNFSHLMDKLKKMGDKSQAAQQLAVDGVVLPQRIKRNLLI
ncbi:hypothetical protein FALBO_3379 [Fusarium albosuccineum]|uniref:DNA (cytosine-5)-methyltransferase 1 replication foci domain-containing protein n=1 Tax=Fusarium albosuccineum TaxID=1237068 RepID=A0A8H4LKB8_9HYPO|nr:hypothetical protein FALBO_3379 [Fusarium albosuccineum]